MKIGVLSNVLIFTAKWLQIFGVLGFVVFAFLFEKGPLFKPSIESLTEKQAKFLAVEAMRKSGWVGEIAVTSARYDQDRWLVGLTRVPSFPSGISVVEIRNGAEMDVKVFRL